MAPKGLAIMQGRRAEFTSSADSKICRKPCLRVRKSHLGSRKYLVCPHHLFLSRLGSKRDVSKFNGQTHSDNLYRFSSVSVTMRFEY
jgi:hypothetical protein